MSPRTCECDPILIKHLTDTIKLRLSRRDHPDCPVGPKGNKCLFKERRHRWNWRVHTEESHVKIEAEIEVMQPLAKECLEPPEAERGKERFSTRAFTECGPVDTLISSF